MALSGGDRRTALAELHKANQRDPFILCLVGQTYEKLGETAKAARVLPAGADRLERPQSAERVRPAVREKEAQVGQLLGLLRDISSISAETVA